MVLRRLRQSLPPHSRHTDGSREFLHGRPDRIGLSTLSNLISLLPNKQGVLALAVYFKFQAKDGHESFSNDRPLSVVNYAVDINALENEKEYKQTFKSLFRKNWDFERS